jgi:hypothetical protein
MNAVKDLPMMLSVMIVVQVESRVGIFWMDALGGGGLSVAPHSSGKSRSVWMGNHFGNLIYPKELGPEDNAFAVQDPVRRLR